MGSFIFVYQLYRPVGQAVTRSAQRELFEVQILIRSNWTRCCQRLATTATFLWRKLFCPGAITWRRAPQTRYTLQSNTASVMKNSILIWYSNCFKNLRNVIKIVLKLLFLPQNYKNRPAVGGSTPQALFVTRLSGTGLFSTGSKIDNFCAKKNLRLV